MFLTPSHSGQSPIIEENGKANVLSIPLFSVKLLASNSDASTSILGLYCRHTEFLSHERLNRFLNVDFIIDKLIHCTGYNIFDNVSVVESPLTK